MRDAHKSFIDLCHAKGCAGFMIELKKEFSCIELELKPGKGKFSNLALSSFGEAYNPL